MSQIRDGAFEPAGLVAALRAELAKHLDVDAVVASFGQVEAVRRREGGELFPLRDHLRGMVLSMLSANRPWRPIADNLERLAEVFGDWRPSFLEQADPESLTTAVKALRCGNTRIRFQMRAIRPNLELLRRIELEFGSVDAFVTSHDVDEVAASLGRAGRYKLAELGLPLAFEYLKNVGVRAAKPDIHVVRICGPDRLGILPAGCSPLEASRLLRDFAHRAGVHIVEFDNLVWLLGADEYAAICGAAPRCGGCALRLACRFPVAEAC